MPIEKRSGETRDEFVSRCVSDEMNSGKSQEQALAICLTYADENFKQATQSVSDNTWSTMAPINVNLESYSDYPDGVKSNAQKVLDWTDKNGWGSCGTPVGKQRANQLAKGEPISVETIQRMYSYLSRHEVDLESSKSYSDGCGLLMYDSWGGKAAKGWAHNKLKELGIIEMSSQIELAKISMDYDETLSTERGMKLAQRLINEGNDIYIISARRDKEGMLARAKELGIPESKVFATGSNKSKVEKVKELGITKHYDNNSDVVGELGPKGMKFKKISKVLFNEDFDIDEVKMYKEMGFKVYIRSSRKIKRKDNKVWNRLKSANLTEDNLVFGEIEQLDKKMNFDLLLTGEDPVLEMLSVRGQKVNPKKVLKSIPVGSIEEAEMIEQRERNSIDLKFATVNFFYRYQEIPGIPEAKSGSRPFCKRLLSSNRRYTLEEIKSLSNQHLVEMFANYPGLQPDVFLYRGGFYRLPGTLNTTAYCRHQWTLEISMG